VGKFDTCTATLGDVRHRELTAPGSAWWDHVHIFLAERAGNLEEVARLHAENRLRTEAIFAKLSAARLR
jgi:hypothetical protein